MKPAAREQPIWTHDRGPLGHGCAMYKDRLVLKTGRLNQQIVIRGQNLSVKEIKQP